MQQSNRHQESHLHKVYVSLGSNMGDRIYHLLAGVDGLRTIAKAEVECSSVYETAPVGYLEQSRFLNMVVSMKVTLSPDELLAALMRIEQSRQRERTIRYGPRTLDLDILLFDDMVVDTDRLQIPHPRMWERAFVVVPLAELCEDKRGPGNRTVSELAKILGPEGDITRVGRFW